MTTGALSKGSGKCFNGPISDMVKFYHRQTGCAARLKPQFLMIKKTALFWTLLFCLRADKRKQRMGLLNPVAM